jgi:hypothetical protein
MEQRLLLNGIDCYRDWQSVHKRAEHAAVVHAYAAEARAAQDDGAIARAQLALHKLVFSREFFVE